MACPSTSDRASRWRFAGAAALATAALLLAGCASYEAAPLPQRDARMMINRYDQDGFILSGALLDSEDCKLYFDRDLLKQNLLPVAVYMANASKDESSFEVRLEGVSLRLADQTEFEQVPVREVVDTVKASRWRSTPLWFLLIVPGVVASNKIGETNEKMLQDYRSKALEDVNVYPQGDKTVNRIVFFRPRDKTLAECDLSKAILSADVNMRGKTSGKPLKASLSLDRN
jgi:hypothetical protein